MERTVRGAFADTIRDDGKSVKVLFDHGHDPAIGNKVLAPISDLREDPDSPVVEGPLLDTTYNRDLLPGLESGVYGSSFRFRVLGDEWNEEPGVSDHNPKGIPERTITKIRLFEAGPVTFPANPDATAGVRSLTDRWYSQIRATDPNAYDSALEVRNSSPRIVGGPPAEGDHDAPDTARDNLRRLTLLKETP